MLSHGGLRGPIEYSEVRLFDEMTQIGSCNCRWWKADLVTLFFFEPPPPREPWWPGLVINWDRNGLKERWASNNPQFAELLLLRAGKDI